MSTDSPAQTDGADPTLEARIEDLEARLADVEAEAAEGTDKMTIISTKGSLDMAYPPLILASTAAAFGWDVTVFHTFWGLEILHEENSRDLKLSAVGNTNMPVPNLLAVLPFMDGAATWMMNRQIENNGTASVRELIDLCLDTGVELQACQMTMDLLEYDESELIEGVTAGVGAATAIQEMADADIQLLV